MNPVEILRRRVTRVNRESNYVRTLNAADRMRIRFVWYPGEMRVVNSQVDTFVTDDANGGHRNVYYTWTRSGHRPVRRIMFSGVITVTLPPGDKGELAVFRTTWEIERAGAGVTMSLVTTRRGLQQRLNHLGYHLRARGAAEDGVDGVMGRRTERALLQFQADYDSSNLPPGLPAAIAGAAPRTRLFIRGEWQANAAINANVDAPNPAATDGVNVRAALRATTGQ